VNEKPEHAPTSPCAGLGLRPVLAMIDLRWQLRRSLRALGSTERAPRISARAAEAISPYPGVKQSTGILPIADVT